jgi:hypothetical protein
MKCTTLSFFALMSAAVPQVSSAQAEVPIVPIGISADDFDFTGTWNYSTANHRVAGACPNGAPMSGTLALTQSAGAVGLMLTSGAVCDPASMCLFDGAIDENGQLIVSNADTVDDEGGSVANAMRLFFLSDEMGAGFVASGYVHPSGFECQWSHYVELWR